jgi:hypothetical protein
MSFAQVKQFRASVVKVNITPDTPKILLGYDPRTSTGVHDSIYHRIIAFDDGATQFFLVSTDMCEYSPALYDRVAGILNKKLKIKPVNFWWAVTHTHSAPEVGSPGLDETFLGDRYKHDIDTSYERFIIESLLHGVEEARKTLQPAKVGVGWGYSSANINRRAIDVNGKASLGLNPDGAVDRRIGILKIVKADGSPLATIANYPIHGTVLGEKSTEISGDVQGVVSGYVEEKTGAPMLFINGGAGNLAPIYSVYPSAKAGHLMQFRVLLGDKIIDAYKQINSYSDSIKLFTASIVVESERKKDLGWPSELSSYNRTDKSGTNYIKLPVRFLKLNDDIGIWSTPLELFCEMSNDIRERSPFPFTFYYGYSNGWLGYLPTEEEWKHGGYETEVSPYTPAMCKKLTDAVVSLIKSQMHPSVVQ